MLFLITGITMYSQKIESIEKYEYLKTQCEEIYSGTWIKEHNECEGITKQACEELGGKFNECASACRHMDDDVTCIMICVPVCSF